MSVFVEVDHIDQAFPLPNGTYVALKNIDLNFKRRVHLFGGHSGCGKSTLLNIVAGLAKPVKGGVLLEGRR